MGFLVITIVGTILGLVSATVMQDHLRTATHVYALAGALAALAGAGLAGNIPLSQGISATQLVWGVVASLSVIMLMNRIRLRHSVASGNV